MAKREMAPKACAACRLQRKKCSDDCLLAPHFPSHDLLRFSTVQRVYGLSNVIKMLKDVKAEQRADVVNSLVSEATARVADPVYGSARTTHHLQKRIADLESQLADTQAELLDMRLENQKLLSLLAVGSLDAQHVLSSSSQQDENGMYEEVDPFELWEPLWNI